LREQQLREISFERIQFVDLCGLEFDCSVFYTIHFTIVSYRSTTGSDSDFCTFARFAWEPNTNQLSRKFVACAAASYLMIRKPSAFRLLA
jgi:hypothetical protein